MGPIMHTFWIKTSLPHRPEPRTPNHKIQLQRHTKKKNYLIIETKLYFDDFQVKKAHIWTHKWNNSRIVKHFFLAIWGFKHIVYIQSNTESVLLKLCVRQTHQSIRHGMCYGATMIYSISTHQAQHMISWKMFKYWKYMRKYGNTCENMAIRAKNSHGKFNTGPFYFRFEISFSGIGGNHIRKKKTRPLIGTWKLLFLGGMERPRQQVFTQTAFLLCVSILLVFLIRVVLCSLAGPLGQSFSCIASYKFLHLWCSGFTLNNWRK